MKLFRTKKRVFFGVAGRQRGTRGMALLLVATTLMFMTVIVTEINFSSRVRLLQAANARDEVAAASLAETGINMYRLILVGNMQLANNQRLSSYASMIGVNLGDALWQMLPNINTSLLRMLFVSDGDVDEEEFKQFQTEGISDEVREASREMGGVFEDRNFLDFEGDFLAEVVDEDSKVNVSLIATYGNVPLMENPTAIQLFGLMSGEEHDQWFYDQDIDRWELISNLLDWVDADNMRSGAQGGYEDDLYNRLESPYLAKNAGLDTKEELRLIEGWQDDVYDRFAEHLTLFGSGKININTASPEVITGLLKAYVSPSPTDSQCQIILQELAEYKFLASFRKPKDFTNWLSGQGVNVEPALQKAVGTKSTVFTVVSSGLVGDATQTITAVMDFAKNKEGRIVFWRVE